MIIIRLFFSKVEKEQNPASYHGGTQYLAHGKREPDKSQVIVRLSEILDEKPDGAIADEKKGEHGAPGKWPFSNQPQYGEKKDTFEKGLIELGGMPESGPRGLWEFHPDG